MTRKMIALGLMGFFSAALSVVANDDVSNSKAPELIAGERPAYPIEARAQGVEGTVLIECLVDEQGRVMGPGVVNDAPPALVAEALKVARNWQFAPAEKNGEATYAVVRIPVVFKLVQPGEATLEKTSLLAAQ
ncbi:MAG: periplasmic protein TonB [Puniceicoccaceae bacterium 5H]|nr:MAG: periplasmic protein TonB [Puniceicoccaceae bacterium 5H]